MIKIIHIQPKYFTKGIQFCRKVFRECIISQIQEKIKALSNINACLKIKVNFIVYLEYKSLYYVGDDFLDINKTAIRR